MESEAGDRHLLGVEAVVEPVSRDKTLTVTQRLSRIQVMKSPVTNTVERMRIFFNLVKSVDYIVRSNDIEGQRFF